MITLWSEPGYIWPRIVRPITKHAHAGPELWAGGLSYFVKVRGLTPDVPRVRMQPTRLGQERRRLVLPPVSTQPDAEPEIGISECHFRRDPGQLCLGLVRIQCMASGANPVPNRVQIRGPRRFAGSLVLSGHCARDEIHATEMIGRSSRFRRAHDPPGLVDPHALRHVDHAVKAGNAMIDVDQAPIRSFCLFDPWTGMFSAAALLCDCDDRKFFGLQAVP